MLALAASLSVQAHADDNASGRPAEAVARQRSIDSLSSISIFVERGDEAAARAYYNRISQKLGLALLDGEGKPKGTLDELLDYMGYPALAAADLEALGPDELMLTDGVQASRFFAPKIVDYTKSATPPYTPGWRKLVSLRTASGSPASAAGIRSAFVLFNFVEADIQKDPFVNNVSKNNQVILVPDSFAAGQEDSAYFLVYLVQPQYLLGLALQGVAFDLPEAFPPESPKDYFVPSACAQCHGHDARSGPGSPFPADGIFRAARLNYLDTDQWHDAMAFDFKDLADTSNGVIFDGGEDVSSETYRRAMSVLRQLNTAVRDQNATVDNSDFKFRAVQKWLDLHAAGDGPIPQAERALDGGGGIVWDPVDGKQQELLGLLSHYCFRCHSSIRYNVFDKGGVADASFGIENRLKADLTNPRYMPQGRILPLQDRDRLIGLVNELFLQEPAASSAAPAQSPP